ncbi:MAG: hypothetical protein OHK93_006570 [Ramalina farinacea]|uniref:Uncharacterized protein n=1 Tax=Ramalina farinacea TaxID=258253 RepID=A0AA43QLS0_9LECA|nr:hypothetical protein [Ramalina farinacea]
MGYNIPNEASEAPPPPYTSTEPAVSNQRTEPQPPAELPVEDVLPKKQLHEKPYEYGERSLKEAHMQQPQQPQPHPQQQQQQQQQQQHPSQTNIFRTTKTRSSSLSSLSSSSSASSVSSIDSHDLQGGTPSSIRSSLSAFRSALTENKDTGAAVRQFRDHLKQQTRMTSASDRKERKKAYKQEYRELRKEIKCLVKDAVRETKQERKARQREKKAVRKEEKQVRKSERKAALKG